MSGRFMVRHARRAMAIVAALALTLAVTVQAGIEAREREDEAARPLLYLPSGKYLRFVALGFDELLSDLIYLWSIQFYSSYHIDNRYDYLERIYSGVISELDPHYLDPYLLGALIMNVEAHRPDMALRLLDKGIEKNPDVWLLSFEAGFLCYNDIKDFSRAARYFEQALRAPDVHPLVRRMYAEMYNHAGDKATSLRVWSEIFETSEDDYVRRVAWNHVHDLKVEVELDLLRRAVTRYSERSGAPPPRLSVLGPVDGIAGVPLDPEGNPYEYDPVRGEVSYGGTFILRR